MFPGLTTYYFPLGLDTRSRSHFSKVGMHFPFFSSQHLPFGNSFRLWALSPSACSPPFYLGVFGEFSFPGSGAMSGRPTFLRFVNIDHGALRQAPNYPNR